MLPTDKAPIGHSGWVCVWPERTPNGYAVRIAATACFVTERIVAATDAARGEDE